MEIKDISSAPQDGTHIMLYGRHDNDVSDPGLGWCEGYWDGDWNEWYHIAGYPSYPTHWVECLEHMRP